MWPWLSRPPVLYLRSVSDFTGRLRVISAKSGSCVCRSVGVMGRNFFMGMASSLDLLEQLDLLIGLERNDGFLPVTALADVPALALHLAAHLQRPDLAHLHREDGLDGPLDLDLVG